MKYAVATAALSATAAYSQSVSPETIATTGLQSLSAECRSAVLSLALSPLTECLAIGSLAPAISANASIVPILDDWMTQVCASEPCDQDLLNSTASDFADACASDLESYNIAATDIEGIVGLYPLVRELVCLKTSEPFVSNSTSVDNSTSAVNSTEETFCVTSLLEELTDYLGANITVNSAFNLATGKDAEGLQALTEIPPSALCQDCIYSAAGLIEQSYPGIWSLPLVDGNFTVGAFLNETCVNETFPEISTGNNTITLPESIYLSAENSSYPYGIIYSNGTYSPDEETVVQPPALPFANVAAAPINGSTEAVSTSSVPASTASASAAVSSAPAATATSVASSVSSAAAQVTARDVTAAKRRWVGQQ